MNGDDELFREYQRERRNKVLTIYRGKLACPDCRSEAVVAEGYRTQGYLYYYVDHDRSCVWLTQLMVNESAERRSDNKSDTPTATGESVPHGIDVMHRFKTPNGYYVVDDTEGTP